MWCSMSNWDGENYSCSHTVTIKEYEDFDPFDQSNRTQDWVNLINLYESISYDDYRINKKYFSKKKDFTEEDIIEMSLRTCPILKPEVIEWLEELPDSGKEKAWCIGNTQYRMASSTEISIFFKRKKDAMAFIKKWSVFTHPTSYFDYFKDDRRKLVDGKLLKY